jgi:hypothetical protein
MGRLLFFRAWEKHCLPQAPQAFAAPLQSVSKTRRT